MANNYNPIKNNYHGWNKRAPKTKRIIDAINSIEEGEEFDCHTICSRIVGHYPPTKTQIGNILGRFARLGYLHRTSGNKRAIYVRYQEISIE